MTTPAELIGKVLIVNLPEARPTGTEQAFRRPAVVVGVPELVATQKYPGLIVVPFSSKMEKYAGLSTDLYPAYAKGQGGLTLNSVALCPQVRFIGAARLISVLGQLTPDEFAPIGHALQTMMPML